MGAAKFSSPACPYLLPRALCTSPLCNTLRRPSPKIASPFNTFHQHCRERESVMGKGDGLLGLPAMAPTVRQLEPDCNKSVIQQPPKLAYSSSMRRMLACGIFPSSLGPGFSDIICHGGHQGGKGKWREGKVGAGHDNIQQQQTFKEWRRPQRAARSKRPNTPSDAWIQT